jgi:hypothetical protein
MELHGKYFCGNKISDYGLEFGYVDYATFAKAFDAVLCNSVWDIDDPSMYDNLVNINKDYYYNPVTCMEITEEEFEKLSDEEKEKVWEYEERYPEVFQWFIVSDNAKWLLDENCEIYTYSELLNCYVWGVTHWGTSWDYVLTNIKIEN